MRFRPPKTIVEKASQSPIVKTQLIKKDRELYLKQVYIKATLL
jgi:hypothetical protein